jgi:hypothetical protein
MAAVLNNRVAMVRKAGRSIIRIGLVVCQASFITDLICRMVLLPLKTLKYEVDTRFLLMSLSL